MHVYTKLLVYMAGSIIPKLYGLQWYRTLNLSTYELATCVNRVGRHHLSRCSKVPKEKVSSISGLRLSICKIILRLAPPCRPVVARAGVFRFSAATVPSMTFGLATFPNRTASG